MPNKIAWDAIEPDHIYNMDCLEGMKLMPDESVDCVICDLPYSMTGMKWDCLIPYVDLWDAYERICKPGANIILFGSGMFTVDLINSKRNWFRYKMIWKKNVPTGMASAKYRPMKYYEEICVFGEGKGTYNPEMKDRVGEKKECYNYEHYCGDSNHIKLDKKKYRYDPMKVCPSDVLEFGVVPNRSGKIHPTQKPLDLIRYLVRTYSNPGDVVLDNCIGSGTTAVACIKESRSYIGFEKDQTYFEKALDRINTGE